MSGTLATVGAHAVPPSSPLLWAIGFGILANPLARRLGNTAAGTRLASRLPLRIGVALLGLSVSPELISSVGVDGVLVASVTVGVTLGMTVWLAGPLGVARDLGLLIAVGTAICGASAIAAASTVVNAKGAAVSYAVGVVTAYGTVVMVVLPLLGHSVNALSETGTAVWAGASIHEVAQVTVAGAAVSAAALEIATVIKLLRVALLAPVIVAARHFANQQRGDGHTETPRVPGFVVAFLGLALVGALVPVPGEALAVASDGSTILLTLALAALGLDMSVGELRARGTRPLALGMLAALIAMGVALLLIILLGT